MAPGRPVAVKMINGLGDAALTAVLFEARLLSTMQHAHVVRLLAVSEAHQPVMLVMELCEGGDLLSMLRHGRPAFGQEAGPSALSLRAQLDLAAQAASGVAYLHSMLCVHRDVAARNVLVARPDSVCGASGVQLKLGDLGLTRRLAAEEGGEDSAYYVSVGACS